MHSPPKQLRQLPLATSRPKICLVLSGGGARGVAHIGVLKVLEELRVPVDCIVGTSMGSLIGGGYAYGKTPAEMEKIVREAKWDSVLLDQPARPDRSVRSKELDRQLIGAAEFGVRGSRSSCLPGPSLASNSKSFCRAWQDQTRNFQPSTVCRSHFVPSLPTSKMDRW